MFMKTIVSFSSPVGESSDPLLWADTWWHKHHTAIAHYRAVGKNGWGSMCMPELPGQSADTSKVVDSSWVVQGRIKVRSGWKGGSSRSRGSGSLWQLYTQDPTLLSCCKPALWVSLSVPQQNSWVRSEEPIGNWAAYWETSKTILLISRRSSDTCGSICNSTCYVLPGGRIVSLHFWWLIFGL